MKKRPFRECSRRERLYRFRQLAKGALAAYGYADADLTFLQYGENVIYRVDFRRGDENLVENSPYLPNRYLLRLHAWDEPGFIESEMIWLDALANLVELPVPAPLRTLDGKYLLKCADPDLGVSRWATLLRWMDGRKMNKGCRPVYLQALGRMVAELHAFTSCWQPPDGFSRPRWDWDAQLGGVLFDVSRAVLVDSMPERFREPFELVSQDARQAMANLGEGLDAFGLIHADLYPENLLFRSGKVYPIDFEDCGYSYWLWDIAVALCTWAWGDHWEAMRDAFFEGYESIRSLPENQWAMLDLFIAIQYATMLLWASAFLQHDPKRADEYIPWRDDSGQKLLKYFNHK